MKRNAPARPRRLRPTDFPRRDPSLRSLEDIFWEFRITDNSQQASVKSLLNSLVKEFAEWIKISQPRLADDRKIMQKMRHTMSLVLENMDRLGFFGTQALKSVAEHLGPMLSAEWINYRFPDDDWAPSRSWIDSPIWASSGAPRENHLEGESDILSKSYLVIHDASLCKTEHARLSGQFWVN